MGDDFSSVKETGPGMPIFDFTQRGLHNQLLACRARKIRSLRGIINYITGAGIFNRRLAIQIMRKAIDMAYSRLDETPMREFLIQHIQEHIEKNS